MTQWLIGIFVRLLSSKDDLINCAGVGKRTLLTSWSSFPLPFYLFFCHKLTEDTIDKSWRDFIWKGFGQFNCLIDCDDLWCIKLCHFINSQTKDVFLYQGQALNSPAGFQMLTDLLV